MSLERLWYDPKPRGLWALLGLLLAPLSALVSAIARERRRAAPARAVRVNAKVISVGNLTVGGAGKTPVVVHLARRLQAQGRRVAVLSRGYGRASRGLVVVADGSSVLATAAEGGDEPVLIARSCPGVAVVVAADRVDAARVAIDELGADTLLLDDGLQHHRLARDLDVVVIDASNPFGNGHVMPRGPMREPVDALGPAMLGWLSKVDQAEPEVLARLRELALRRTGRGPVEAAYRPVELARSPLAGGAGDGQGKSRASLEGEEVWLLAGLARPGSFRKTVESLGATIAGESFFADHHAFTPAELDEVERRAGSALIVLTEKDAVRLPPGRDAARYAVLRIELDVRAGEDALARVASPEEPAARPAAVPNL